MPKAWWFAYAFGAEWRLRFWLLDHDRNDAWSIKRCRQKIVGETRVLHSAVVHDDFFHHSKTEALSNATLDLTNCREGIEYPTNVLRGGDLHHLDEAEFDIYVDNSTVGNKSKCNVAVALTIGVEVFGFAMVMLKGFGQRDALRCFCNTDTKCSDGVNHIGMFDHEPDWINVVQLANMLKKAFAHQSACSIDSATAHPCLA